jgi:hypothetical protein
MADRDHAYSQLWEWLKRYSESMEGLMEQSKVRCARDQRCLDAETVHVEVACDVADRAGVNVGTAPEKREPGYFRQEMMGIGGVIKQKRWQDVTVGRVVDLALHDGLLKEEREGRVRSWCGWCDRVIPAKHAEVEIDIEKDGRTAIPIMKGRRTEASTQWPMESLQSEPASLELGRDRANWSADFMDDLAFLESPRIDIYTISEGSASQRDLVRSL